MTTWRPILSGAARERAIATSHHIADALRPLADDGTVSPSLAGGWAGLALLFAYVGDQATCMTQRQRAAAAVGSTAMSATLGLGFPGVGWAEEHLERRSGGTDDLSEGLDEAVLELIVDGPFAGHFDLMSGLVGLGVYALERLPRGIAADILTRVADRLAELAVARPEGVAWFTRPELMGPDREHFPAGYFNLGVAHGTPGVIALLAAIHRAGVAAGRARELLEASVSWLLAQRLTGPAHSLLPTWVGEGVDPSPSRLAWCYGDLGASSALLQAARALARPDWERDALAMARHAARRPPDRAGHVDACLCHGAAGIGHLFNRLHQETGDPELLDAALVWIGRTVEMQRPGAGYAGYLFYAPSRELVMTWMRIPGLLGGVAGIALALLAAAGDEAPAWDRALLMS